MTGGDRLERALAVFERLLDLEEAERYAELTRECGDDADLRALIERLLEADGTPDHEVLDGIGLPWHGLVEAGGRDESETAPAQVGPYRLIREAGRGGMATVYLAERDVGGAPQRVALKLVRRGIDTDEVISRFAHETRVLASLEHPNIARFYDAGVSADGRPFLVMEYVEGRPITRYCDTERLSVAERLGLFATVCDAVQFAHQRLVVHRDIKPSNVLVTDEGEARLVDFGIAKLLEDESDADAPRTRTGLRVLTPEYAAPEQLRGESISTATDVYTLGLVLYELLTGSRAHRPRGAGFPTDRTDEQRPGDRGAEYRGAPSGEGLGSHDVGERPTDHGRPTFTSTERGSRPDHAEGPGAGSGSPLRVGTRARRRHRASSSWTADPCSTGHTGLPPTDLLTSPPRRRYGRGGGSRLPDLLRGVPHLPNHAGA